MSAQLVKVCDWSLALLYTDEKGIRISRHYLHLLSVVPWHRPGGPAVLAPPVSTCTVKSCETSLHQCRPDKILHIFALADESDSDAERQRSGQRCGRGVTVWQCGAFPPAKDATLGHRGLSICQSVVSEQLRFSQWRDANKHRGHKERRLRGNRAQNFIIV